MLRPQRAPYSLPPQQSRAIPVVEKVLAADVASPGESVFVFAHALLVRWAAQRGRVAVEVPRRWVP